VYLAQKGGLVYSKGKGIDLAAVWRSETKSEDKYRMSGDFEGCLLGELYF
jgi:hypothetical protein